MTDTIDWSKPVEVWWENKWHDVEAVMKDLDGRVYEYPGGGVYVVCEGRRHCGAVFVSGCNIRNKPKKLECWANVWANGGIGFFSSEGEAKMRANAFVSDPENHATRTAVHMVEADQ